MERREGRTVTETSPPIPGQLCLVPDDLEQQTAAAAAELARLEALKLEHTLRAVDGVRRTAGSWRSALAELDQAVHVARAAGATWQQIADAAGMTKQSAHGRWGGAGA